MKKWTILLAMIWVGLACCMVGCGDGDDEETTTTTDADPAQNSPVAVDDAAADAADAPAEEEADNSDADDAAFAALRPSGLSGSLVTISGSVFSNLRCNPIDGAVSYTFADHWLTEETVPAPAVAILAIRPPPQIWFFTVYARNANGVKTPTITARIED